MKNIFKFATLSLLTAFLIFSSVSCNTKGTEQSLEIEYEDMHKDINDYSKLITVVERFIWTRDGNGFKTSCGKIHFNSWKWELKDKIEVIGTNKCGGIGSASYEYWTVFLRKNKAQGIYVYKYDKRIERQKILQP